MLKRTFDPSLPYRVVLYLRRSSKKQNDRSPAQQEAEIRRTIKKLKYPWIIVKVYQDTKSGRYLYNRPGFMQMLQELKSGLVQAELILLDTTERLARSEEIDPIRKDLREKHGVLALSADGQFADPSTPQGRVYGAFETLRSVEENRVKAHQVVRGKRDHAQLGYWPGGPRPFGFKLVSVIAGKDGEEVIVGKQLEPFADEDWIIQRLFERAEATGHGQTRLAKFLNADRKIPDNFKPFHGATVGHWLDSPIYMGTLVWAANCTGVVDETRRVEKNPEEDVLRIPDFCPALVTQEQFDNVQAFRNTRRDAARDRQKKVSPPDKYIAPLARGLSLTYLLTGLARCGLCGASMRPVASGKKGSRYWYVYYQCPRYIDGNCENGRSIPEPWLRDVVVNLIKERLFPV